MATYVNDLRLKEIATGDESGTWGTSTNTNLELIAEAFSYSSVATFDSDADKTETIADGATDPYRSIYVKVTSGVSLTATRTLTIAPNTVSKIFMIENATSGSQSIAISQGSGANVTIPNGDVKVIYLDGAGSGAAVVDAFASLNVVDLKVQDDLTVTDDLIVNGDIDLEGNMDVNGTLETDALSLNGTTVTSTAAELNLLDGSSANTVVNSKAVIYGSSGELAGTLSTAAQTNITSVGALNGGSITSGFGSINVGSSAITTTGTVTGNTLAGTLSTAAQTNVTSVGTLTGLTVNNSEVLFDNPSGDFTLKLNTNAVGDKNEIIMGDTGTPLVKFGVGGTANDIITGSDAQDFNIGTSGGGRAINFSTDNYASVEMKFDGGQLGIGKSPSQALDVSGNIAVSGTVDGRDVAADGTKLDGIESGATADQTITAGTGLSGGGTGNVTLNVDLSELTDMTATMVGTDEFIVLDASADRRKAANEIGLSIFNNDAGFTTNVGDITAVTAGTNLTGGGTSGAVTINMATGGIGSGTYGSTSDGTKIDTITVDAYGRVTAVATGSTGDINAVTAGSGLTGGGTSGSLTLNVGAGTGIDVAADSISVDVSDFMSNGSNNRLLTATGTDGINAEANFTFDGTNCAITGNLDISGNLNNVTDIYVDDQIIHTGDTDTYLQFHAANEFRVVTGGTEMLEVNDSTVKLGANLDANNKQLLNVEDIGLNDRIEHDGDTNTYIQFHAADQWRVVTGGTERLEVNNTNVTLSSTHLHVDNATATGGNRIIGEFTGNSTDNLRIDLINAGTGTNARSAFTIENNSGYQAEFGMGSSGHSSISNKQFVYNGGTSGINLHPGGGGSVDVIGNLTKSSGSFNIKHPKPEMRDTHRLIHSFVESPEADNIYSGTVTLVDGQATVNLDSLARMSDGTWVNLNTDSRVFTTNETGWDATKGAVSGNTLTITCQDATSTDTISFLIIARRIDEWVMYDEHYDENGRLIVEREAVGTEIGEPSAENRQKFVYDMNWNVVGPKPGYDINGNPIEE